MNLEDAQVVSKILSKVAFGFTNSELIGHHLFPRIDVASYSETLMKYDKSAFVTHNFRRAPGSKVQEVTYSYGSEKISLIQEAVFAKIPKEWLKAAKAIPNLKQEIRAINMTMAKLTLALEKEHAEIAQNPAGYSANHQVTLTAADSFANPATDTQELMVELCQNVRRSIGRKPNVIELPSEVFDALRQNALIREHFKYTSAKSLTVEMLAEYWQIPKVIIAGSLTAENENSAEFTDVWNDVVLAYIPPEAERDFAPSYGYTYEWEGHPLVHEKEFDTDTRSWRMYMEYERRAYQHGAGAGALIRNPLAA